MGLRRSIWKDILWLNSFGPTLKVAALVCGIALIVGAWYFGTEWWMAAVNLRYTTRPATRLEIVAVILAIILITYIIYVVERDRKSR